ncbi:MAG: hypothetical protein ACI4JY_07120, partial [Oscillospiraceae bacterium]
MAETNTFTVNAKLPSLNEYIGEMNNTRYKGNRLKKAMMELIQWNIYESANLGKCRKVKPSEYPVELNIEWHEKDKRRDVDNIKSAAKFLLDAMTGIGLIVDDGRKHISQIHDTVIDDKETF